MPKKGCAPIADGFGIVFSISGLPDTQRLRVKGASTRKLAMRTPQSKATPVEAGQRGIQDRRMVLQRIMAAPRRRAEAPRENFMRADDQCRRSISPQTHYSHRILVRQPRIIWRVLSSMKQTAIMPL
jgi:hypothetical protein